MQSIDPRIIEISFEVNGRTKTYSGLNIYATGMKYANSLQNECEIKISNLDKQTRDYILTETSPYNLNRTPKIATVRAGRESYGTSMIFKGNIVDSTPSQPPDITVTLKCLTGNFGKGNIIARNQPNSATLNQIARQISKDLNLTLNFQAQDKNISNYSYTGPSLKQVDGLGELGNINAYVDDDSLIVKNANTSLSGITRILNVDSGMIGIPEITERGIKVKYLLDNTSRLGGALRVQSVLYPAANGDYIIYKLGFEIATRDTPFYWIAEGHRR